MGLKWIAEQLGVGSWKRLVKPVGAKGAQPRSAGNGSLKPWSDCAEVWQHGEPTPFPSYSGFLSPLSAKGLYGSLPMEYYPATMRTLEQVESDVRLLPAEKQEELRDWLENLLEDQLELTDEFRAKIERGELDIREGRSRVRKP